MADLHDKIAKTVPQIERGKVWCRTCGRMQRVDGADALRNGWPKCCGYTMTIDSPEWKAEQERAVKGHYSFDDMHIGIARVDNRCLETREIPRPPALTTNAEWYAYAKTICDRLNAPGVKGLHHQVEAPQTPWIRLVNRPPLAGQLIVKRWKNGAVWAGHYAGTAKDSSFDEWYPLP